MTREEFERFVADQLRVIAKKMKEYCPESLYLSMAIGVDEVPGCMFWNRYYGDGVEHVVDCRESWEEEDGQKNDAER